MRTKLSAWYKQDLDEVWFGVKVLVGGRWADLAETGKACIYPTQSEAEAKRGEMRKRPSSATPSPLPRLEERRCR